MRAWIVVLVAVAGCATEGPRIGDAPRCTVFAVPLSKMLKSEQLFESGGHAIVSRALPAGWVPIGGGPIHTIDGPYGGVVACERDE